VQTSAFGLASSNRMIVSRSILGPFPCIGLTPIRFSLCHSCGDLGRPPFGRALLSSSGHIALWRARLWAYAPCSTGQGLRGLFYCSIRPSTSLLARFWSLPGDYPGTGKDNLYFVDFS